MNTLYLDKVIAYENIIQAFSRTNRVFGPEKPFGSIRYYRKPHTMTRNIGAAVKLYSGDKPFGLFVDHLDEHLNQINQCFGVIKRLFAGIDDFSRLPDEEADRLEFARVLPELYEHLQAAQVQGFTWEKDTYQFADTAIAVELTEPVYIALLSRYKELDRPDGELQAGETARSCNTAGPAPQAARCSGSTAPAKSPCCARYAPWRQRRNRSERNRPEHGCARRRTSPLAHDLQPHEVAHAL